MNTPKGIESNKGADFSSFFDLEEYEEIRKEIDLCYENISSCILEFDEEDLTEDKLRELIKTTELYISRLKIYLDYAPWSEKESKKFKSMELYYIESKYGTMAKMMNLIGEHADDFLVEKRIKKAFLSLTKVILEIEKKGEKKELKLEFDKLYKDIDNLLSEGNESTELSYSRYWELKKNLDNAKKYFMKF
ncbi:hypothetical protein K9M48_01465 [Candidatus Gracilibacteria bacterium]|nr:hypothetical protein [Candidatus Gracilibacteria bacterium]